MNLRYELPARDAAAVEKILECAPEYCLPADLSIAGKLADGYFTVGGENWAYVEEGRVLDFGRIADGTEYKLRPMVGNAYLEAVIGGRARMLARISMKHAARYGYLAQILNCKSTGERVRIYEGREERVCPKCGRPIYSASGECPTCTGKTAVFKRLIQVAGGHARAIFFASSLLIVISGVDMVSPYLQKILINTCFMHKTARPDLTVFTLCILGMIAAAVTDILLHVANARIVARVGSRIAADLRALVFRKVQDLSIGFLSSQRAGDVINRISSDTDRIRNALVNVFGTLAQQIVLLVGVSTLLFVIDWRMALVILLPAPLVAYIQYAVWVKVLHRLFHHQWRLFDRANSFLHDVLSGIRVVKAFGKEEGEVNRFVAYSDDFKDATVRSETVYSVLAPISNFIIKLGQYAIIFMGCAMIMGGSLTVGDLVQFLAYAGMVYGPLTWLMYLPRSLGDCAVACDRIFTLIDEKPEVENRPDALRPVLRGAVEFDNVTFGYQSYEPVLKNVTLKVKPGEMIGLVGHSGAGKSTMINLILRFYDVNEGAVRIDGNDLREIDQQALCSQIGVVLQEPFLFSGTILDNIRYSKPNATEAEVVEAARTANAHDFILRLPDGYDTLLDENGSNLSGGERQRISIARAVLNNPKILILDEATSALDTETEALIQEALQRLTKSRTTFAIAHRLATLRNADRLVVLDKGRIAEVGTHEELLCRRGIYYNLVMAQREMTRTRSA